MPILEQGTNFPNILGRKTFPPTLVRAQKIIRTIPIANQAMALVRGETPVHLAQRQTPGGGSQLPAFNAPGIFSVVPQVFKQVTGGRLRQMLMQRPMLGKLRGQTKRNIPTPYERPGTWPRARDLATVPSVTGIIEGPVRTVHPEKTHMSVVI